MREPRVAERCGSASGSETPGPSRSIGSAASPKWAPIRSCSAPITSAIWFSLARSTDEDDMASAQMDLLLWNLQPPTGRKNWHGGPSPVGALRGVTAAQAAWRPTPRRKSIWELALHIAYWKYTVRRHLEGGALPRFPRSPANFPSQPEPADDTAWARDVALLRSEHERLLAAVRALSERRLGA